MPPSANKGPPRIVPNGNPGYARLKVEKPAPHNRHRAERRPPASGPAAKIAAQYPEPSDPMPVELARQVADLKHQVKHIKTVQTKHRASAPMSTNVGAPHQVSHSRSSTLRSMTLIPPPVNTSRSTSREPSWQMNLQFQRQPGQSKKLTKTKGSSQI